MDHELQLLEARQLAQQAAASLAATALTSRGDRKPRVLLKAATPHAGIGAAAEGSCCALAAATVAIAAARHVATIAACACGNIAQPRAGLRFFSRGWGI